MVVKAGACVGVVMVTVTSTPVRALPLALDRPCVVRLHVSMTASLPTDRVAAGLGLTRPPWVSVRSSRRRCSINRVLLQGACSLSSDSVGATSNFLVVRAAIPRSNCAQHNLLTRVCGRGPQAMARPSNTLSPPSFLTPPHRLRCCLSLSSGFAIAPASLQYAYVIAPAATRRQRICPHIGCSLLGGCCGYVWGHGAPARSAFARIGTCKCAAPRRLPGPRGVRGWGCEQYRSQLG